MALAARQVAHVKRWGYSDERPSISEGSASGFDPAAGAKDPYTNEKAALYAFVDHNLSNQGKDPSKWRPVNRKQQEEPRRVGSPPLTFEEYITKYPKGCFVCYWRNQVHDNDNNTCK